MHHGLRELLPAYGAHLVDEFRAAGAAHRVPAPQEDTLHGGVEAHDARCCVRASVLCDLRQICSADDGPVRHRQRIARAECLEAVLSSCE